ncbi:MAG: aminofutalosine synthase MqnE [Prolixibacteraceae bacterium]|jgi:aminodeoxyfutalosine synthase|nr:aminofutalosine synthase MqnE [Prolixibacteraceae bacterium]MDI9562627.1 aminofutalosine synthase MqnE [Bacteroidota bacterium]NLT00254.1 aminofutalosine synthase MqnE [Bacteroidales bacterium]OQB79104.1 MAG: Aminodeoxyfutalosine synthase [Bacteroidetes bacterium ADurb.Bin123]HNU77712.1 aminofutalosine synthase MqnE [Prolixibacteraceae bacterium]
MSFTSCLSIPPALAEVAGKVGAGERITAEDALQLYNSNFLSLSGLLAVEVKKRLNGDYVYFNNNFHIEPTNVCINHCKFCSFRRNKGQKGSWECTIEEMVEIVRSYSGKSCSEVHIVGGVHPDRDVWFYADLLKAIREEAPLLQIKAFTAVEVDQMCKMAGMSVEEGLQVLKDAGLVAMPGGGAEIFDETLRAGICPDKTTSTEWLSIHETAHRMGIPTNATMLYGLKENYLHRVDHLSRLRDLQDKTGGFNAFIPLKFRKANNLYASRQETSVVEDLKNFAVSRIFLDNIPHLKAYWPMIGKQAAQLSLHFGVDDLDGTIDDSTRIYAMAGAEEQNPSASTAELTEMIRRAGYIPAERDTLYKILRTW